MLARSDFGICCACTFGHRCQGLIDSVPARESGRRKEEHKQVFAFVVLCLSMSIPSFGNMVQQNVLRIQNRIEQGDLR